jgi:single stranded DNA-binding protein
VLLASGENHTNPRLARVVLFQAPMADGLNKVLLFGNLGADPELRLTPGGQSVLSLRMATTEVYFDKERVKQERVEWHTVTVWGRRADALAKLLGKGSRVLVEGRIHNSSYEKDGVKKVKSEVVAEELFLAGGRRIEVIEPIDGQPLLNGHGHAHGEAKSAQYDDIPF